MKRRSARAAFFILCPLRRMCIRSIIQHEEEGMRTAILGIVLALGACTSRGEDHDAARATVQRSFPVGDFRTVSLEGAHDVVVAVGAAPSVRAEGEADDLERLDIRVENGTLKIGMRGERRWFQFSDRHRVTVYVTAPALNGARIEGSGDMR